MEGLRVMRGKKARLSKKMQNILLLNSENSIPVCTPVEFQTVLVCAACISHSYFIEEKFIFMGGEDFLLMSLAQM